jgi:protein involved in polysaccharide export with SLBB domain
MNIVSRIWRGGVFLSSLCFLAILFTGEAQVKKSETVTDMFSTKDPPPGGSFQPIGPALESTIAAESYFVGPSDVIAVNIWVSPPIGLRLTVTPEGTLIIPSVGEIRVSDMTLADARKKVYAEVRKRYSFGEATITLVAPREVVVTVQGRVLNQGSYTLPAYKRIDKAVEEANVPRMGQLPKDAEAVRPFMSTRWIIVRHKDGAQSRVDLRQFLVTKDDRWNPYLREGDLIIVPPFEYSRNVIGVYGQVNVPGRLEYAEGDSVKTALRMAHGFTPLAHGDSVEFTRQDSTGEIVVRTILNGTAILAGTAPDFPLQSGDRLVVFGRVDQRGDYTVNVAGQVTSPGIYPITRNSTHLSDIIRAAGGFTEDASLVSAELVHQSVAVDEIETERLVSLRGGAPPEDSAYYYLETELRMRKETVTTDFVRLFLQGDSTQDAILRDGDAVMVPKRKKTIYVFGQVVNPGHVPFQAGQGVTYYLSKAGGLTDRARESDLKIVKSKTQQWLAPEGTRIEEGDYVWVPMVEQKPFGYYLGIVAEAAAVVSAAISVVLLVIQINK